jgi:nitrile hydratase
MSEHEHHHHEEHAQRAPSALELRVRALEARLTEKGYIDPAALDVLVDAYQTKIGPRNGARVVARAWFDPEFRRWLLQDATAAIASLGFAGRQGEHMVAVENTPDVHNMVVPLRPVGTEHLNVGELANLVTRDSMIGTGLPKA